MLRMAGIEHKLKQTMEIITRIGMKIIVFYGSRCFIFLLRTASIENYLTQIMEIIHRLGIKIP